MGPMRNGKGVIDIHIAQPAEFFAKGIVVGLLFLVETEVLE